jgi:hypothetical protein
MAVSGNTSVTVTTWDTLKFSWSAASQSVTNNTTTVSWRLELVATSSGQINSTAAKNWSVTVNGVLYSGTNTVGISNNSTKVLASGTTVIAHNTDGTKTFSYSFSQEFGISFSGSTIGTKSGSGTATLNTIPRKSTFTASNGTLGTAQTITITKASSNFTHTLTYVCGTASGTIATKTSNASVSFTPPLTLASQSTTSTNVSLTLTLTTYSGDTAIGTNSKHIVCAIPASVKPTISSVTIKEAGDVPAGFPYIQSKSQLNVVVSASGIYGSSVSVRTVINGISYAGTNITSNILTAVGDISVTITATDSRGRTATTTKTVTVYTYAPPTVTASLLRCDSSGNEDEQGEYMKINYNLSVLPLNTVNTKVFKIQYKKTTATSYTTITINATSYTTSGNRIVEANSGSTYDVIVSAADSFAETKKNLVLSTAYTIFNIKADGKGFSFGKVAEKDGVEIAMPLYDSFGQIITNGMSRYTGSGTNAIDPNTTLEHLILTDKNTPTAVFHYVITLFYGSKTDAANKTQIAVPYYSSNKDFYFRYKASNVWSDWVRMTGDAVVNYTNSNANYQCKKYTDGTMEISGGMDISGQACNTALGGWYRTAVLTPPTYIQNFVSVPDVVMSFSTSAGTGAMVWETNGGSVSVPPTFYLIRPTSSASVSGRISIVAKGRWK